MGYMRYSLRFKGEKKDVHYHPSFVTTWFPNLYYTLLSQSSMGSLLGYTSYMLC